MSQITENPRGGCVLAGINSVLGALHKVCPHSSFRTRLLYADYCS